MQADDLPIGELVLTPQQVYHAVAQRLPNPASWLGDFRANCLVTDTETTGFDPTYARLLKLGLLPIYGGACTCEDALDLVIQTPYDPHTWGAPYTRCHPAYEAFMEAVTRLGIWGPELRQKIDNASGNLYAVSGLPEELTQMADRNGKPFFQNAATITHITAEQTLRGLPRHAALDTTARVFREADQAGLVIVGHNLVKFDLPFLSYEISTYLGEDVQLDGNRILDTGMLVKAAAVCALPNGGETLLEFFRRVADTRSYAPWALDGYCVEAFGLDTKYGVDKTKQHHSAGYDCWVTYCLLKELSHG